MEKDSKFFDTNNEKTKISDSIRAIDENLIMMGRLRGYFYQENQKFVKVNRDDITRLIATDGADLEEIAFIKNRAIKFYGKMGDKPVLPANLGDDLELNKGLSLFVLNLGMTNFCKDYQASVPAEKCLKNIAKEGVFVNNTSYILKQNDPEMLTNFVGVLEAQQDINYRDLAERRSNCLIDYLGFNLPNSYKEYPLSCAKMTKNEFRKLSLNDLSKSIANDVYTREEIAPLLNELGSFGFVLNTNCKEFKEFVGKDEIIKQASDENFQQKMYAFGVPSAFVSGIIANDFALLNDEMSGILYQNFGDRIIYNSRGEVVFSPQMTAEKSEKERAEIWQNARENEINKMTEKEQEKF